MTKVSGKSMDFIPFNCSIVIVAKNLAPGILNPDFLSRHEIVNEDWKVVNSISLPPFSEVIFDNGVQVRLDPTRCRVMHFPCSDFNESPIPRVCEHLIARLTDTELVAVGNNYNFALLTERPDQIIRERIFGNSEHMIIDGEVPAPIAKLVYSIDPQLSIAFESATLTPDTQDEDQAQELNAVSIDINAHRKIEKGSSEETLGAIRSFFEDWATGFEISKRILEC